MHAKNKSLFMKMYLLNLGTIIGIMCLTMNSNLLAQEPIKLIAEANSGVTFRNSYTYRDGISGQYLNTSYFKPAMYYGLGIGLSKDRYNLYFDKRGQAIVVSYDEMDFNSTYYYHANTFAIINRFKFGYSFIQKPSLIADLEFAYSLPLITWRFAGSHYIIDQHGNKTDYGSYYYLRSDAYFSGLKFLYKSRNSKYRMGLNCGVEWLRNRIPSGFSDWPNLQEKNLFYYMAGINVAYVWDMKVKKKRR